MPVTIWSEMRWALFGCLRLARGDRGGMSYFDRSLDGFWRSFFAALLSYPLFLLLLMMRVSTTDWNAAGGWPIIVVETIGYVISWVAFPLVMLRVLRWLGRPHRFFDFMVPYNWWQLPQSALFVVIGLEAASGALSDPITQVIGIAAAIGALLFEWYIALVALETTSGAAVLVVLVDLVLGVLITRAAGSLY